MPRFSTLLVFVICWGWATLDTSPQLSAQEPAKKSADKPAVVDSWQAQIEAALQKPVTAEFMESPLADIVAFLKTQSGILILLDQKALDNAGIAPDVPVTCKLADISLRSVLHHIFRDLGCQFVLRDGALVITTNEEAEKLLREEVYDVTDLERPAGAAELARCDGDALIDAITSTLAPQSWSAVGGPGSIECFRGRLVVSQQPEICGQIGLWLAAYRQAKQLARAGVDKVPPLVSVLSQPEDPAATEVYRALDKEIAWEFRETPLEDLVAQLRQVAKINIAIDKRALDSCGVGTDTPVTFEAKPLKLRFALRHILSRLGLDVCVRDQVLLVTSCEESEKELVIEAYPVADLLGHSDGADLFGNPRRPATIEQLEELLTTKIASQTWSAVGGPGSVAHCGLIDVLVISQSPQVHEQVADLLRLLRQNLAQSPKADTAVKTAPRNEATRLVVYSLPTAAKPLPATPPAKPNAEAVPPQARELSNSPSVLTQVLCGGVVGGVWAKPPIPEEQLVQLIAEMIEPESWKSRKDVYLRAVSGRLLVRHTEAVHRQVQDLLAHLGVMAQPLTASGSAALGGGMF